MLTRLRTFLRSASRWFPLSSVPEGFFGRPRPGAVSSAEQALTISAFWSGLRLYQNVVGSLPLVTYKRNANGREVVGDADLLDTICYRPNPAQSRAVFFHQVIKDMFLGTGNSLTHVRRTLGGRFLGLYPIKAEHVLNIAVDEDWNKAFHVWTPDGPTVYFDDEVLHLFLFSLDGIAGVPLLRFAGESLGLHREVLTSASAYFQNRARPSGYLKYPNKLNKDAIEEIKKYFMEEYRGSAAAGKVPVIADGGEYVPFDNSNAKDAELIAAMGASVGDVGRWLNLSPLALGDLSRGTYSNLGADNVAIYQRSVRPLLDLIELELNWKVHGRGSEVYSEFLTEAILRGDPVQQAQVANTGIMNGSVLRSEQRGWLNLPAVAGLDRPLYPANMWQLDARGDVIAAGSTPPAAAAAVPNSTPPSVPDATDPIPVE
jgi:HK97 family phage portal protein